MKNTNHLIDSKSPYLLQHAHNPVDWYPWGAEALTKAQKENKPIILSIGYSSCHWCHVMAHESFENDTIAQYMNTHFVNIKLDREERPDIDNIYMDAVQAMGLRGGWPLNVFLTPDQKPFYGGTYFPKDNWLALLQNISKAYDENFEKLSESAEQFALALQKSEADKYALNQKTTSITDEDFKSAIDNLKTKFDSKWGGMNRAPKFPMPAVWNYLAIFSNTFKDELIEDHLLFTLDKIAQGGIYDQIGGGFSRYSVDGEWHVPHFEKMLYDNGQLLSLYANAFKISGNDSYKQILLETAQWLKREMMNESGGFYSALDADSEGVEGKFYVWSYDEVNELAGENIELISRYYDVSKSGNWEETNVLRRLENDSMFLERGEYESDNFQSIISKFKAKALAKRSKRVSPGLDDKIISGWNGLVLTGLLDAYQATGDSIFQELANKNVSFINSHLIKDNKLIRIAGLDTQGFLEDYAAIIQALIKYYETQFDLAALEQAVVLTEQVVDQFYDSNEKLFYYTSNESENLIARKKEIFDNVIPSSNAIMAENLYKLGLMMDREDFKMLAVDMVWQVSSLVKVEPEYMSYWASVTLMINHSTPEIIIVGDDSRDLIRDFHRKYIPNKILMAGKEGTPLPLFDYKSEVKGQSTIYVCFDKTCKKPTISFKEALSQIE